MSSIATPSPAVLDPGWALSRQVPFLGDAVTEAWMRLLLLATGGAVRVEGASTIENQPDPALFALTHHGSYEALVAPAALLALRRGRPLRFFVDWMFLELPFVGGLIRRIDPIAVYRKPARWRWRERRRLEGLAGAAPLDRAQRILEEGGSVGVYPEGRRNPDPHLLLPLRQGVARLALRTGAPVLPIGIDFPARDRLGRTPRVGRMVLRAGEALDLADARREWLAARRRAPAAAAAAERELVPAVLEALAAELARLSRKVHLPQEKPAMTRPIASTSPDATLSAAPLESSPARRPPIRTERVSGPATRAAALKVLDQVYRAEKGWLRDVDSEIPESETVSASSSWFVAWVGDEPAGAVRLAYDPPLDLPREAEVELDPRIDFARLEKAGRFVEVGRLVILPRHRARTGIVLSLMHAVIAEVVARGYTHLLTVVFEDDPHSPYQFHTRVLGFERIGTHRHGELACRSRRIILTLDIARAYLRMKASRKKLLERLAGGLEERLERLPSSGGL